MEEWIVAESLPADEAEPRALMQKWINVAEDLALVPALNVRMRAEAGMLVIEVSPELYDTFSGH